MPTAPLVALVLGLAQIGGIQHEPITCLAPGDYPVVDASIRPGADVRSAKVYFRSDKYPKYYYVELSPAEGRFHGVLPRPSAETERIVYYIEAVDVTFMSTVGSELSFEIRDDCAASDPHREPVVPPAITVGAVEAGAPALPPGFETAGIIGTIASTGVLTGLGGGSGVGIGTALAISGIAAGAGGVVAVASGAEAPGNGPDRGEPTGGVSEPPPATPPTPPPPTPPPPTPPPPSPPPPSPPPTPEPPPPEPPPPPPPPPPSPVSACFTATFPGGSCNMKLDGSCSSGSVQTWSWELDPHGKFGGVSTASGSRVNRNFHDCNGETVTVTLTVTGPGGGHSSSTKDVTLPKDDDDDDLSVLPRPSGSSCFFASTLSEGLAGRIVVDAVRTDGVVGGVVSRHAMPGTAMDHVVEAWPIAAEPVDGLWSFDFASCTGVAPGSLRPEGGPVFSLEPLRITFRVEGTSGERFRFRVRLTR